MHSALLINGGCVKGKTRIIRPRVSRSLPRTHTQTQTLSLSLGSVIVAAVVVGLAFILSPFIVVVVVVFAGFCVCFIKTSGAILKQLYLGLPLG